VTKKTNFFKELIKILPKQIWQIPIGKMAGWVWGGVFIWGMFLFHAGFTEISLLLAVILAFLLIWISIADIRWHIIPFPITFLGTIGLGIARWCTVSNVTGWQILFELGVIAGIGVLIFGIYFFLRGRRGWGWGDTFLLIMIGSGIGLLDTLIAFLWAIIVASMWGVGLLLKQQKHLKSPISMAPFITIGVFITQIWGARILSLCTQYIVIF